MRCLWGLFFTTLAFGADALTSGDAYIRFQAGDTSWTCGTSVIEQRLQLSNGKLLLASLRNRLTGTEFTAGADSDEFRFVFGGVEYNGRSGEYRLKSFEITRLAVPKTSPGIDPGVSLLVQLEHPKFQVSLHYDVYASTPRTPLGMIRKWYTVTNRTGQTQPLTEIGMNRLRLRDALSEKLTLHYWQGGGADQGTNEMRTEVLAKERNRTFYSLTGAPAYRVDDVFSGSASYHPYFVLEDPKGGEGLFLGFNYLGPWSARIWHPFMPHAPGMFLVSSQLELHTEPLAPGAAFEAPNSFTGVYKGDLDSAGEQLQDWQATFKWDLTRENYLWTTTLGNSHWNDPAHKQRTDLHTQMMWRIADLCRRSGATIAHEDDFWFDQRGRGVWEGIDWADLVNYLRQSGIHFRLWMPPQHYAAGTPPDTQHPDWALVPKAPDGVTGWYGLGFCAAAQGAHDYMRRFMLEREKRYGDFYYRLDGWVQAPCSATNHDHPQGQPHVQQYRHYLRMLREVKEANPGMGLQGCNSGGEWCNWDKLELVENNQMSDGGGADDLYNLSYFWPITKLMEWWGSDPDKLDDAALMQQDREDILMRRRLRSEHVLDRYMRVYHPRAEGARDEHTFLQIANAGRTKGAIFMDAAPQAEVVVFPKRLVEAVKYTVAFRFNKEIRTATGAELMHDGIRFRAASAREMVLLNIEHVPGHGTDRVPPTAPPSATKQRESYGGQTGVAVRWSPSSDNVMVAEYIVLREGKPLDRVGIGTFYFDKDRDSGLDRSYEVIAVDGDGNRSGAVTARAK
ncbi:MAG TPA: hypothetical protein VF767_02525 [Bryobacteraceae bacterium]